MTISGSVRDTNATDALPNAVAMAVRLSDSVLVKFTRTNDNGLFKIEALPIDTYQVIVSHPQFADQIYIVSGSAELNEFDFGKIILPPKTQLLNEVTILGFKDPVYYKGDTLIYTADSFKVRANATVEDLLKKLPGMRVDAAGKITTQGKTVDKVLVDGDEFFGSDPTVATRNLNASNIESVQVYDKKNENTSDGADETVKVLNLKLKEDAKKGYFGKVDAASDGKKFYEGQFLANRFRNKQKVSLFALAGNTPKTQFNFSDVYKYGLNNEMQMNMGDNGTSYYYMNNSANGIPQTLKTGAYFTDYLTAKTKLLANYSFNQSSLKTTTETHKQYFLTDTSYTTNNTSTDNNLNQGHSVNLELQVKPDSLTTINIKPGFTYTTSRNTHTETNTFNTEENVITRQTDINNSDRTDAYSGNMNASLQRSFKKKERNLYIAYVGAYNTSDGEGFVKTTNSIDSVLMNYNVDQKKKTDNIGYNNNVNVSFTEPLNQKFKVEVMLDFASNGGSQLKNTFDFVNQEYGFLDSTYSNNFKNLRLTYRPGARLHYETKNNKLILTGRLQQIDAENSNLYAGYTINQRAQNVLPAMFYRHKFSQNSSLNVGYNTTSRLPQITQLQPVPNNSNPNYITLGNPDLQVAYTQNVQVNYYSYKPISGFNMWAGMNANFTNKDFGSSITYDGYGRTVTQTVNVNGNYYSNAWLGARIPLFKKVLSINPQINGSYNNYVSFVNGQKNTTNNLSTDGSLELSIQTEKFNFSVGSTYQYTVPKSTLSSQTNQPYTKQEYTASMNWELPKKFIITQEATYTINSKRANGYNLNYLIWNASIGKKFTSRENIILAFDANDILNQNISNSRSIQSSVITDTKTSIIKRYFLLRLTYKFNNNKTKEQDDMF